MDECIKCKKSSPDGSRFCPFCGEKLTMSDRMARDPLIGLNIADKFQLKKKLGSGAMGSIYMARHTGLEKDICLKILHKHLLLEEGHFQRFRREARSASKLEHPNIITIYDFGTTPDEITYIAMEFVEGKDLATKLYKEGAIPIDRVVHITAQICDALDEAHSKNVVHRDMKPENVMICPKRGDPDFVKVLDFGIAKIRDGSGDAATFQTATGLIFGTPEYMSPEQIRGEELDGRSDLYSLGIMIYQMLTNKLPFAGNSILEIATKHISYPPPSVREILPDVPEKIDKTILRLLSKKRENRFTSAADLKKALTSVPLLAEKTVLMTPDQLTELSGSLRKMKEARIPEPAHAAVTSKNAGAGTKKHAEIQEMDTAKVAPAKEPAAKQKQVSEKKATPAEGVEDLYDYLDKKEKTFFGRIFSSPTMYIALIFIGIVILITVLFFLSR